jgi:hypothetical protein
LDTARNLRIRYFHWRAAAAGVRVIAAKPTLYSHLSEGPHGVSLSFHCTFQIHAISWGAMKTLMFATMGSVAMANAPENATSTAHQVGDERRRHLRVPFTASVEVIEPKSKAQVTGRTSDLSLGGCYVDAISSFPAGSAVLVRITRGEDLFEGRAKVVYAQVGMGMGIAFVSHSQPHAEILQKWLLEIGGKAPASQMASQAGVITKGLPTNNLPNSPSTKVEGGHRELQQTPAVGNTPWTPSGGKSAENSGRTVKIGVGVTAVFLVGVAIIWWEMSTAQHKAVEPSSSPAVAAVAPELAPAADAPPAAPVTDGPTQVGTTEELAGLWASKEFTFIKPITNESVKAMVIRLPDRNLWAFALQEPRGQCDLEFVTDPNRLAQQYRFRADHPMVASPCSGTIYDPLKLGEIGANTWVRGAVVQGTGLRPPISINVALRGNLIVADDIE